MPLKIWDFKIFCLSNMHESQSIILLSEKKVKWEHLEKMGGKVSIKE
jgi:hypothetical protein